MEDEQPCSRNSGRSLFVAAKGRSGKRFVAAGSDQPSAAVQGGLGAFRSGREG